jgi:alpha-tubulin suppressor-like RCC1 family protein
MVAAGANHSLCLTDNHHIFSCGYNAKGQLGLGDDRSITMWSHVGVLKGRRVTKIFAGGDHSWAIIGIRLYI